MVSPLYEGRKAAAVRVMAKGVGSERSSTMLAGVSGGQDR
jgi:hypothetical protein